MRMNRWLRILGLLAVGGLVGAVAIIASIEVNHRTSSEAFCTSCHSMAGLGADPNYLQSAHRSNNQGVTAGCADCHIPRTNWFIETYTHVASGVRDIWAETTNDFSNPKVWETRRIALAHEVRDIMRRQDSVTCRSCHDASAIRPTSRAGQAAHALLRDGRMTCIDCHFNLVHAPVPPTPEFLRGSGLGGQKK